MSALVSVVMPCFNAATYLNLAIDSILRQSHADLELIIVDDGSSDGTAGILGAVTDPRVIVLRNERNRGVVESLNRGFAAARGDFIARMDADDISLPDRLAHQLARFREDPQLGVLGTAVQYIDSMGQALRSPRMPPTTHLGIQWRLLWSNCLHHPTVMLRRAALPVPVYSAEFADIEDWELWFRLGQSTRLGAIPQRLLAHRRHTGSVSGQREAVQQDAAARLLQRQAAQYLGIELTVDECRGFRDPAYWLGVEATHAADAASRSSVQTMSELSAAFLRLHPQLTAEERREIEADQRFYLLRAAFRALSVRRGSVGRRLATLMQVVKSLRR